MSHARSNGRGPLDDDWSAIYARRAAAGGSLPADIEKRLHPEWLEAVTLAEQDGPVGLDDWLAVVASRYRDDPSRLAAIRDALEAARNDPGGEPPDGRHPGPASPPILRRSRRRATG
jgi:hypothetical protein